MVARVQNSDSMQARKNICIRVSRRWDYSGTQKAVVQNVPFYCITLYRGMFYVFNSEISSEIFKNRRWMETRLILLTVLQRQNTLHGMSSSKLTLQNYNSVFRLGIHSLHDSKLNRSYGPCNSKVCKCFLYRII